MFNVRLTREEIEQLLKYVDSPGEVCANIKLTPDNKINIYDLTEGPEVGPNVRGTCTVKKYSPIIFHSHIRTSYPPPSIEDIIKVIKHRNKIQHSIIVCKWGFWVISNDYNKPNQYNPDKYDELYAFLKHNIDQIILNTRDNFTKHVYEYSELSRDSKQVITDRLRKICNTLNIDIKFYEINVNQINLSIGMFGGSINYKHKYEKYKSKYLSMRNYY